MAHLPGVRFALGEPEVETTTIDSAATALEKSSFFLRSVGADGYRIHDQATLRKVVSDRRASLDEDTDIKPAVRRVVQEEFARGAPVPVVYFPENGDAVQDSLRLTMVVLDPAEEWRGAQQACGTHGPMDQGTREFSKALSRSIGLVRQEAGERVERARGAVARVASGGPGGVAGHPRG